MFQVIDNNKPADCNNHKVDKSWNKSKFETLDEAFQYADNWLGIYGPMINNPFDYSGYGDIIEIRFINE